MVSLPYSKQVKYPEETEVGAQAISSIRIGISIFLAVRIVIYVLLYCIASVY